MGEIYLKKDCKGINLFVLDQDFIQLRFSLRRLLLLNAELLTKLLKNRQKDSLFFKCIKVHLKLKFIFISATVKKKLQGHYNFLIEYII